MAVVTMATLLPGSLKGKYGLCVVIIYFHIAVLLLLGPSVMGMHVTGKWETKQFNTFLAQFGFQAVEQHNVERSSGYIYGNITTTEGTNCPRMKLVALDEGLWTNYSKYSTDRPSGSTCTAMFKNITNVAYDRKCTVNGTTDIMRSIPCQSDQLCFDENERRNNVVPGYQFTIQVNLSNPSFWYINMVSCYQNWTSEDPEQCSWHHHEQNINIIYDIWLVNGNPLQPHNIFYFQFSYPIQGIVAVYLMYAVFYLPLTICHTMAHSKYMHPIIKFFTVCLYIEYVSILLIFIHLIIYSQDGSGLPIVFEIGIAMEMLSQCLFIFLLLLLAKGWTITTTRITQKKSLVVIWVIYCVLYAVLFIWEMVGVDQTSNLNEYQTWPGALILTLRCIILIWFLMELRTTYRQEYLDEKLSFYRWFGVGYTIWFVYLPITVSIISAVSPLWRQKSVSAMTLTADFLSYLVMTLLFWPSRSSSYFKLGTSGNENKALLEKYSHLIESI
ncbi:integral membrane protein GPR180-like [Glandiceps talaboti]